MILRSHQTRIVTKMQDFNKGRILVPTGGGKTLCMIVDAIRALMSGPKTIVVVAPRILLANQLCSEFMEQISHTWTHVCHVHSGETEYFSSTKSDKIAMFNDIARAAGESCIIFTTYNSLNKVVSAGIDIDIMYCDEAHNSTRKDFFKSVASASMIARRSYYFTATPRNNRDPHANGMNNTFVYGDVIERVPAQELIESGSIIPPTIHTHETDIVRQKDTAAMIDSETVLSILDTLDETNAAKVLVAAPSTRVLWNMLTQSDVIQQLTERGFEILHITSKHGAYVNKTKVSREVFFDTLTRYGKDDNKKFLLFHYSILSEGINVPGLTHCILLRNLPLIEMAQTIGRVIRLHIDDIKDIQSGKIPAGQCQLYRKSTGFVTVPVHKNYGGAVKKRLQYVVDSIFKEGKSVEAFA